MTTAVLCWLMCRWIHLGTCLPLQHSRNFDELQDWVQLPALLSRQRGHFSNTVVGMKVVGIKVLCTTRGGRGTDC